MKGETIRRRLDLRGQVQGVGFRPFVYRLATELGLGGYVGNTSNGAVIEIQGPATTVARFETALFERLPPLARVSELSSKDLDPVDDPVGGPVFDIHTSTADPFRRPEVTPDAATCPDCLAELFDPRDCRHHYPFINCTNCGPRYSIIRSVPYDRPATTMAVFKMCPLCDTEYSDPRDRRFHAQPNACPRCGPQLRLCRPDRSEIDGEPVPAAAAMLQEGRILAIKGIGGYHLACRADREDVVTGLRQRKLRDGKPLAVMVRDIRTARQFARLTPRDEEALRSPAAPIVLAAKPGNSGLAPSIAPGCSTVGLMIPYAPVHHLLFAHLAGLGPHGAAPLVMTSANLAGHPLTYRDDEAFDSLSDVADAFLIHDREIFRPIDDSVTFTFRGDNIPIRRARGYAPRPLPVTWPRAAGDTAAPGRGILAVGAELKSTVCLLNNREAILSEHLGDLSRPETYRHFVQAIDRLQELFGFRPAAVACDLHPQYLSTRYAAQLDLPVVAIQHHHAHIASVLAEHGDPGPVIGLSCDGTGYGTDGAVWGCELLLCSPGDFKRLGHLEYFPLVGGDAAAIETWRPAAALLRSAFGTAWRSEAADVLGKVPPHDLDVFEWQASAGVNAPPTSSLGRVFDAVAFLLGLCDRNRHEAEAAMALEAAAAGPEVNPYPCDVTPGDEGFKLSLAEALVGIQADVRAGQPIDRLAARFHETVAHLLATAAVMACESHGLNTVAVSGGCFANRRLLERVVALLESERLSVLYNRRVPAGDGGVALGQAAAAAWQMENPNRSAGS